VHGGGSTSSVHGGGCGDGGSKQRWTDGEAMRQRRSGVSSLQGTHLSTHFDRRTTHRTQEAHDGSARQTHRGLSTRNVEFAVDRTFQSLQSIQLFSFTADNSTWMWGPHIPFRVQIPLHHTLPFSTPLLIFVCSSHLPPRCPPLDPLEGRGTRAPGGGSMLIVAALHQAQL
jgi:hypothetical protein